MALTNKVYTGKGLSLTIDGTEYNMDITSASLTSEEKAVRTFADLSSGARQWTLTVSTVQDVADGALWRTVWDEAGTEDVAFVLKPHGNATASDDQGHITGTVTIPHKPDWVAEVGTESEVEIAFEVDGEPVLDVTP